MQVNKKGIEIRGAFHLEKGSGNFGLNLREFLYGKKLFHFAANFACVEVRVAQRDTKMAGELILLRFSITRGL